MHDPLERLRNEAGAYPIEDPDLGEVIRRGRSIRRLRRAGSVGVLCAGLMVSILAVASIAGWERDEPPGFDLPAEVPSVVKAEIAAFTYESLQVSLGHNDFDYLGVRASGSGWVAEYQITARFRADLHLEESLSDRLRELQERLLDRFRQDRGTGSGSDRPAGERAGGLRERLDEVRMQLGAAQSRLQALTRRVGHPAEERLDLYVVIEGDRLVIEDVEGPLSPAIRQDLIGHSEVRARIETGPSLRVVETRQERLRPGELTVVLQLLYSGPIPSEWAGHCRARLPLEGRAPARAETGPLFAPDTEEARDEILVDLDLGPVPGRRTGLPVYIECSEVIL